MGSVFVKKGGKWGMLLAKKVKKWGGCKKVDLSSTQGALCTVSVFFILHFTYLGGGCVRTQRTPLPTGLCCCRLAAVGPAGRKYRSMRRAASECGQCHVVSVRR